MRVSVTIHPTKMGQYCVVLALWNEGATAPHFKQTMGYFQSFTAAMQYKQEVLEGKQAEQGVYHLEQ